MHETSRTPKRFHVSAYRCAKRRVKNCEHIAAGKGEPTASVPINRCMHMEKEEEKNKQIHVVMSELDSSDRRRSAVLREPKKKRVICKINIVT